VLSVAFLALSVSADDSCPGVPDLPTNIRVFAIPSPFFVPANKNVTGSKNSGFLVDLLDGFKQATGIPYTLTARSDLTYSAKNPNGSYDGSLIGALLNNEADLVGPDVFILSQYEPLLDFLFPINTEHLTILANKKFGLNGAQYVTIGQDTLNLICKSKNDTLQAICKNLKAGLPGSIVETDEDGVAKVTGGKFAYVEISAVTSEAAAENPDVLMESGSVLDLPMGLAVQQNSPLRDKLNTVLIGFLEDGTLDALFAKYNV